MVAKAQPHGWVLSADSGALPLKPPLAAQPSPGHRTVQFPRVQPVDNKTIATVFYETADLMEINGDDSFRIRSYRRAAETIEGLPQQVSDLADDPKKLLEIPGIGKGMAANIQELTQTGKLQLHQELLQKYHPSMLELFKIQGLGPKTIALIWSAFQVSDLAGVEKLAKEGKLRTLPRMSEKSEQKILKAIEDYRRISGRFLIDEADRTAERLAEHLKNVKGIDAITPAGSLRRGRETVGDLDVLDHRPLLRRRQATRGAHRGNRSLPRNRSGPRQRRQQGQLQAAQRIAGRCAHLVSGFLRRRTAVFHRLQEPRCRPSPARFEDGSHVE